MSAADVLAVMRRDAEHAHEHRCDCPSMRDDAMAKQVESIEARAAVAEVYAQRDAMVAALRKLDSVVLPAAMRYRAIGPGNIEEAQEIVRAALARCGGAK